MANADNDLVVDEELAEEAKGIVMLAFRKRSSGRRSRRPGMPTCSGKMEYSHITQGEMKRIMKFAVNKIYALLWTRTHCPDVYPSIVGVGARFASDWDPPERTKKQIEHSPGWLICCGECRTSRVTRCRGGMNRNDAGKHQRNNLLSALRTDEVRNSAGCIGKSCQTTLADN